VSRQCQRVSRRRTSLGRGRCIPASLSGQGWSAASASKPNDAVLSDLMVRMPDKGLRHSAKEHLSTPERA
jgi:hypothetical protein